MRSAGYSLPIRAAVPKTLLFELILNFHTAYNLNVVLIRIHCSSMAMFSSALVSDGVEKFHWLTIRYVTTFSMCIEITCVQTSLV